MDDITLGEAFRLFIHSKSNLKTQRSYRGDLSEFVAGVGPANLVIDITPVMVERYVVRHVHRPDKYASATIYKKEKAIKALFNYMIKLKVIDRSPAAHLSYKRPDIESARGKEMPEADADLIVEYLRFKPAVQLAAFLFLRDTGCREQGAITLTLDRLFVEEGRAIVIEKGQPPRDVYFFEFAQWAISRYLIQRGGRHDPHVFISPTTGQPYGEQAISQMIRRACKRLGLKPRGSHSLRHAKAFKLSDDKVPDHIAAELLGHSAEIYRAHYAPRDAERIKAAAEAVKTPAPKWAADDGKIIKIPRSS